MLFFSLETTTADFKKEYYITKKFKIIHSKNNLQYFTNLMGISKYVLPWGFKKKVSG